MAWAPIHRERSSVSRGNRTRPWRGGRPPHKSHKRRATGRVNSRVNSIPTGDRE